MLRFVPRAVTGGDWRRPDDIAPMMYELLIKRGIASEAEARAYLRPSASDLRDPFLLSGMRASVDRLARAVEAGESICVYGDYDADGVCACAILVSYLRSLGARAEPYLPSRHQEGYGLNESAVKKLAERFSLLVTVDCGITAVELVKLARSKGLDVLITDHHRPEDTLPDCPVVNPLLNDYPYPYLCGAGVALKLVTALGGLESALEYVDYAAIATIADIVPLTGENRVIAALGLSKLNAGARPGVRALAHAADLGDRLLNAGNIAFQLAPRLNAGGRLGDAMRAYSLLTETRYDECERLAEDLNAENARRKQLETETYRACERALDAFDFPARRAIVVAGEGWNPGVIGLAASRLTEKYHYPSIVLTQTEGILTGSCRSIEGVDIHAALTSVAEYLIKFGGHRMAAGLTLKAENLDAFTRALDEYLKKHIPPDAYVPAHEYDAEVTPEDMDPMLINALGALAPTGCGNPAPVFRIRAEAAFARGVGADKAHLKFKLKAREGALDAIWFRNGERAAHTRGEVEALFTASVNAYQGRVSVQAEIKALRHVNPLARVEQARDEIELAFPSFLTHALYNQRYSGGETPIMDARAFRELAQNNCQGLLIVAAGYASAKAALSALNGLDADVEVGAYPLDARCFRTVTVCPLGEKPEGYRHVLLAGAPDGFMEARARLGFIPLDPAFEYMPDIDMLRKVYAGARTLIKRPHYFTRRAALEAELSDITALNQITCAAALAVLEDMKLIMIAQDARGIGVTLPACAKSDPEQNSLYQLIRAWRTPAREGRREQ